MNRNERTNTVAFTTLVFACFALAFAISWKIGYDLGLPLYSCDRWLSAAESATDSLATRQDATKCDPDSVDMKRDVRPDSQPSSAR